MAEASVFHGQRIEPHAAPAVQLTLPGFAELAIAVRPSRWGQYLRMSAGSTARRGAAFRDVWSLLFALLPPEEVIRQVADVIRTMGDLLRPTGRPTGTQMLHVTLRDLGVFDFEPMERMAAARLVLERLRAAPVVIRFDQVVAGRSGHILLRSKIPPDVGFRPLQQSLQMTGCGDAAGSGHSPHMTLWYGAYATRGSPVQPIEPIVWEARQVFLLCNHWGRKRYERVGRCPLSGQSWPDPAGSASR